MKKKPVMNSVYENLDRNSNENRKWKEISGQLQCSIFLLILATFTAIIRQMRYSPPQAVFCEYIRLHVHVLISAYV